jgi:hypothetical protein
MTALALAWTLTAPATALAAMPEPTPLAFDAALVVDPESAETPLREPIDAPIATPLPAPDVPLHVPAQTEGGFSKFLLFLLALVGIAALAGLVLLGIIIYDIRSDDI